MLVPLLFCLCMIICDSDALNILEHFCMLMSLIIVFIHICCFDLIVSA